MELELIGVSVVRVMGCKFAFEALVRSTQPCPMATCDPPVVSSVTSQDVAKIFDYEIKASVTRSTAVLPVPPGPMRAS